MRFIEGKNKEVESKRPPWRVLRLDRVGSAVVLYGYYQCLAYLWRPVRHPPVHWVTAAAHSPLNRSTLHSGLWSSRGSDDEATERDPYQHITLSLLPPVA